jgi:hypothetical protein
MIDINFQILIGRLRNYFTVVGGMIIGFNVGEGVKLGVKVGV